MDAIDERDCERLKRAEFEGLRCLMGAVNYTAHSRDDLQERLSRIPQGVIRMNMVMDDIRNLADDIIRTIPVAQCKQLRNTMMDYEIRMVPKLASMCQNVVFEKDLAKGLIDAAMEKCHGCVEDADSCRKCGLYKILEGILPLDSYDDRLICPYSVSEWEE